MIDHGQPRLAARPDPSDAVAMGRYLASSAGCHGCHGAQLTGGGGPPPGGSNITPVGIGGWSERDFVVALRTHRRPDGSFIDEAMPRAYGDLSDQDLAALYAYVRSVPPAGTKTANQLKAAP
jgi:mono/diheme cytochrome c family protein